MSIQITEICDIRPLRDFQTYTFSKYKKADVRKELLDGLISAKIETACFWAAEFICGGQINELWQCLIYFYSRYIHLGAPKVAIYLERKIFYFNNIYQNAIKEYTELDLRNNYIIRQLFVEIIHVLCYSKRCHSYDTIKIITEDFDLDTITEKCMAPSISYVGDIFEDNDPKELIIFLNELAYNLSNESHNIVNACYWIEWFIEYEQQCRSKKMRLYGSSRNHLFINTKYQTDPIWILIDIFIHCSKNNNVSPQIQKIIEASVNLFRYQYVPSNLSKKKYLLYFMVSLFCDPQVYLNFKQDILTLEQKEQITIALNNIDTLYLQIKQHSEITHNIHNIHNIPY